jgi:hypothetical protein
LKFSALEAEAFSIKFSAEFTERNQLKPLILLAKVCWANLIVGKWCKQIEVTRFGTPEIIMIRVVLEACLLSHGENNSL